MEVLVRTPTIEKLILENRDYEIRDAIEAGKEHYGSQSFDQSLLDLYHSGIITEQAALENSTSPADLKLKMGGLTSGKYEAPESVACEIQEVHEEIIQIEDDEDIFALK